MLVRDPVAPSSPEDAPRRRTRRARRAAWLAVAVAVASAGWFGADAVRDEPRSPGPSGGERAGATATVERRTLVERENVDGTLGYAGSRTVLHRIATGGGSSDDDDDGGSGRPGGSGSASGGASGSSGSGTVTWLASSGSIVRPGGVLYRVDDEPVVLMDGSVPAYRRLAAGVGAGPDVRQLERNLVDLGFGAGVTVDDRFTAATAGAVRRWQRHLRLPRTGAVELGRIVFLSGTRRVGERRVSAGAAVADGAEVLETTSTRRVVQVELEVSKQSLVRRGDTVRVTLPDDTEVSGRVTSVGRAARQKDAGDQGGDGTGGGSDGADEPVIDLTVALGRTRGTRGLDRAPVTVAIARRVERRALSVPVTALLAQPGGGYSVEVVEPSGRRRVVRVSTGFFAGGFVQVRGRGVRPGARVAVPE